MMLNGTLEAEPGAPVAGELGGDDRDPDGAYVWHRAAVPNRCERCGRDIGIDEEQTVAAGAVIDRACAPAGPA
jgi:hypothetical protein